MKTYHISEGDYEAAKALAKKNQNKHIDKRLQVILLRYEGLKDREIGEKLGYHRKRVSQLCAEFCTVGLEEYARNKHGGNHRNMSREEEALFLKGFEERAAAGEMVDVREIKAGYTEKVGRETRSRGHIYTVLERNGWRKVMPRSKHPNQASEAEIKASKKLTNA